LVVACEWGPLKIFRNDHGQLTPWDPPVTFASAPGQRELETRPPRRSQAKAGNSKLGTLSQLTGWWHGVTTGDLDGDGRLDIVASNWGRNSKYSGSVERPWRLYYGDLGRGEMDLVEARLEPTLGKEAPERSWRMVRAALPFLQERIQSYGAYGQAGVAG